MVTKRKQHSSRRPVKQGPGARAPRPNKIGAAKAIELPQCGIFLHLLEQRTALGTLAAGSTLFDVDAEAGKFGNDSRIHRIHCAVTDCLVVDATGKQLADSFPIATRSVLLSNLEKVLELILRSLAVA